MLFFLSVLVWFLLVCSMNLEFYLHDFATSAHKVCVSIVQTSPQYSLAVDLTKALVCGENLQSINEKNILKISGLIHIFVVSGSHFLCLQKLFLRFRSDFFHNKPRQLTILNFLEKVILLLFCSTSGFSAPCVRALLSLLISFANRRALLFWSPLEVSIVSTLLSLLLFNNWWASFSLALSSLASVSYAFFESIRVERGYKVWLRQLVLSSSLTPILTTKLSILAFSISANLGLGIFCGEYLFPLALATWFLPNLIGILDKFSQFLFAILQSSLSILLLPIGSIQKIQEPMDLTIWAYIFTFMLALWIIERRISSKISRKPKLD